MTDIWINWARTERSTPTLTIAPDRIEHIVLAVVRALETGHTVKPIGGSHSFTGIGGTEGIRLDMRKLRGLISVDHERSRVTLWAGTFLWELPTILDPLGLALPNMGDIDRQTISGATQTGTHGTGLRYGGLATGIVGMTLVTGTGEVLEIDESDRALLDATALGLGALGIVVSVTVQCVPSFLLRAEESPDTLERVLRNYAELSRETDHFEFYWFPHTKHVRTKKNTRLDLSAGREPLSPVARWVDEELVNNTLLGGVLAAGRLMPGTIPSVNRVINGVSAKRTYTDRSHRVFVTSRRVRFTETEFSIPLEAVPRAITELDAMIERTGMRISFPIEVRNAPADTLMLSTAHGRETGYIAVHRYHRDDHREYFREAQAIMRDHGGRPHWGKMHNLDAEYFAQLYPRFSEFLTVRDRLDPNRVFTNPYLEQVLGR